MSTVSEYSQGLTTMLARKRFKPCGQCKYCHVKEKCGTCTHCTLGCFVIEILDCIIFSFFGGSGYINNSNNPKTLRKKITKCT